MYGPFSDTWELYKPFNPSGFRLAARQVSRYKSSVKPYLTPLPYRYEWYESSGYNRSGPYLQPFDCYSAPCTEVIYDHNDRWTSAALNRAYDNLVASVRDGRASLGASVLEANQSFDMIARRGMQLLEIVRDFKKGKLHKSLRRLRSDPPRATPIKTGGAWLEYWMGWAPLCGDIKSAVENIAYLRQHYPVKGSGVSHCREMRRYFDGFARQTIELNGVRVAKYGGHLYIANDCFRLASQLGLTNPALVLYELTPFSWMLDWFTPIGSWLERIDAFAGLDLRQTYSTEFVKARSNYSVVGTNYPDPEDNGLLESSADSCVYMRRSVGLTAPGIPQLGLPNLSPTRAATAVSLLLQELRT